MKKITTLLFLLFGLTTVFSQEDNRPEYTGENFSLEGALALFKKANSLEDFEQLLNQENNNVNNLDINDDGEIDYIMVDDIQEGDTHAIVLSTYLDNNEKQDIATIGIEKTGTENAILQIEGDSDLYAENTIVEPSDIKETITGEKGPDSGEYKATQIIVNVWLWPSVRFIYGPKYNVWHSPWRWRHYPKWWKPWRPYSYTVFYSNCAPHRMTYHRVPTRRVVVARKVYSPRRHSSTLVVHNRRGTTVIHKNKRGTVKAIKVRDKRTRVGGRGRR
jgi:hypothetical protein